MFSRNSSERRRISLALDLKTFVSLLGDGELDAVASGQGDVGLGAFADDEDVSETGGESVAVDVLVKKIIM